MIKKTVIATLFVAFMCAFALPAHAQFGKKLGKSLGNAAKSAGKAAQDMATDAAVEMGATKASDNIILFMDNNNVVAPADSEYTVRLAGIIGDKFATADGKALSFAVYESDEANIIALNNGSIRIYSGMMDLLTDDEIKALLALQVGHINAGNVKDNLLKAAAGESTESAGTAQLDKLLSFSGDGLGTVVNELVQISYTEDQNEKADKIAKDYLKTQGGDIDSFDSLLDKFEMLSTIDLDDEDLDDEDETVIQAISAAKFINVNNLR